MGESLLKQIAGMLKRIRTERRWLAGMAVLSLLVIIAAVGGVRLHGVARTYQKKVLECTYTAPVGPGYAGYAIHVHNSDCCDENGILICPLPQIMEHRHTDGCLVSARNLICPYEENHVHTDACWQSGHILSCGLPEDHIHTDACWMVNIVLGCGREEDHIHTDACYSAVRGELICGLEEGEEHTHSDACYAWDQMLICGQVQPADPHVHSAECYVEERIPVCGQIQPENPHIHTDACYTEERTLICGQEEGHVHTDVCWLEQHMPICGLDEVIAHIHDESCLDENGQLACGLLEVETHVHGPECFRVVELTAEEVADMNEEEQAEEAGEETTDTADAAAAGGDSSESGEADPAAEAEAEPDAETVFLEEKEPDMPAQIFSATAGDVTVLAEAPEGAFPPNTRMEVSLVEDDDVVASITAAADTDKDVEAIRAVDIRFFDEGGNEIEPQTAIRVTMSSTAAGKADGSIVVQVAENGETIVLQQTDAGTSDVSFESDRF